VSCALPFDISLEATIAGTTFEFSGEIGLAREWLFHPLDAVGQGWVSACLFAHVSAHDVEIPISVRGPHPALALGDGERERFPLQEGAFYGNFFTRLDRPIEWIACRGADQAATPQRGTLADRGCAEPDDLNPGFTQCGFIFAGDCGTFPAEPAEPTCEEFSERGQFYRRCHAAPLDDDERHHGHGAAPNDPDDRVFPQVITTYVTP
jgi:hypothetical protein